MTDLPTDAIRLVPLGGLGEIGMNCLAIEQRDGILVVDCGVNFPSDDHGIDVIHPDFSWLFERADRVSGIFLTHGHEDHIGGLPYLLEHLDVSVWGPPHALGLARRRLQEHDFRPSDVKMLVAQPGETYGVGPFEIEPIRVAHSIVEASALAIRTAAGRVLHTGDFKFDPDPPDGEPTDETRLSELGDEGVDLLLSDSTNVDRTVEAGPEKLVGETLFELVSESKGLVVVALFASNIQRLMMLGEIAVRTGRKICLLGRSLRTQSEVATEIGRLDWPSDLLIPQDKAQGWPRDELMVLAGGTQGEPRSSFSRIAAGKYPGFELEAGDTVIMSSRIIPGNDRMVYDTMGDLLRRGVRLCTRITDPGVHVSGHASRLEQERMIELTRPKAFVPLHGTLHHLVRHGELARALGVEQVAVVENGTSVLFNGRLEVGPKFQHGKVPVSFGGSDLEGETLAWRVELGRNGVAVVCLAMAEGRIVSGPTVLTRGVPGVDGDGPALASLVKIAQKAFERARRRGRADLETELRRAVRRELEAMSGTRPTVEVQLLET